MYENEMFLRVLFTNSGMSREEDLNMQPSLSQRNGEGDEETILNIDNSENFWESGLLGLQADTRHQADPGSSNAAPRQNIPAYAALLPSMNDRSRTQHSNQFPFSQEDFNEKLQSSNIDDLASANAWPDLMHGDDLKRYLAPKAAGRKAKERAELPTDFTPCPWTVQLGRGRCTDSAGNRRMRDIVKTHLDEYSKAPGKLEKSFIVSRVVKTVKEACPVGAFVKYEKGKWISVDDRAAREKVGAAFRDALHNQYKSSSKSKTARRKQQEAETASEKQNPDDEAGH